ncbi:ring canal kelch-like protein [Dinothrombium tinctorium]|uniref:Ring canal kelch-like protein n=1 Tax=Dinothrombium tinctorium TaxID=1965070 RepID=A0A443QCV8_9ACAR|nr:ring canal kelch-like protein [Dinothrombium tinctorium]
MRSQRRRPNILLVVGGQIKEVKATRQCEFYDFSTDLWYVIPSELPTRRCGASVDVLNGNLYAINGFNGSLCFRTVDSCDPQVNRWIPCPSMEARRSTLGVCVLNNKIYAVGGFNGSKWRKSAEVFDQVSGKWSFIPSKSKKRANVGVVTVNDYVFGVGSYGGASLQ